jgi:acetyltransferase-like isoleucine patch superfamily enzyme
VFLGIGSTLKDGITIGEGALIGAGSLVLSDIPPHTIAYGSPAKVIGRKYHLPYCIAKQ